MMLPMMMPQVPYENAVTAPDDSNMSLPDDSYAQSIVGTSFITGAATGGASVLKRITQAGAKVVNTVVRKAKEVVTQTPQPTPAPGTPEDETLLYVAVGAGVLYFATKKKRR